MVYIMQMPERMAQPQQQPAGDELLSLDGIGVRRDERTILEDISLAIRAGELVSIIGPNGGGKTTLLKVIAGSDEPSSGSVRRRPGLRIGYQPQRSQVAEHIPLQVRNLLRHGSDASEEECVEHLEGLGLDAGFMGSEVASLSGGERQRVMIVRAFLRRPQLLLLDEPGTYCEHRKLSEMYERIESFSRSCGCATVMISHDLSRVLAHSDRIYHIDRRIKCEGGPESIAEDTEFMVLTGEQGHTGIYRHRH